MQLVEELLQGNRRAVARLISLVENDDPQKLALLKKIYPHTGSAYNIGITGAPGSGKSSLVDLLLQEIRDEGLTAGVIAVDPTSPFSGGAILGDRIRMQDHALDNGIFIRSMGTRGSLGGLSRATREAVQVLDAFGKDLVLIETVGVGQSEVDIVKTADTTVVVLTPAGGDSVQTMKAGIMEIADVFVINKADLPGAERTIAEVNIMLDMKKVAKWRPPVLPTIAIRSEGIGPLWQAINEHRHFLEESGRLLEVRRERVRRELMDQVEYLVKSKIWDQVKERMAREQLVEQIILRKQDPYNAARELLEKTDFSFGKTGEGE
ncbi:MAG TPA: methylmalonyl Co-A mutase-associated GTPase MeaB [Candidatus Limnocylindrales bacterium]|nr:methylmalonyl Co-A mutase-associated GTPase MeaB [Candidatus Limnocylindrales bacterium]